MNDLTGKIKGIVLLQDETFEGFLAAENSMKLGIYFLVACFLIAAFPAFVSSTIDNVQPFTVERAEVFQEEFLRGFEIATQFMPADEDIQLFIEQFKENFAMGTSIAVAIDALPRPLPRAVGGFFQSFGGWISSPFTHLASWLSYAIWVLLFAKISGGRGGVNRFLGLTALYAVPNLLGLLGFIPIVGPVFRLVGVIWGWVVYIKAVQISQEFSPGKAILMVIMPVIIVMVALFFITFLVGVSLASLISATQ